MPPKDIIGSFRNVKDPVRIARRAAWIEQEFAKGLKGVEIAAQLEIDPTNFSRFCAKHGLSRKEGPLTPSRVYNFGIYRGHFNVTQFFARLPDDARKRVIDKAIAKNATITDVFQSILVKHLTD